MSQAMTTRRLSSWDVMLSSLFSAMSARLRGSRELEIGVADGRAALADVVRLGQHAGLPARVAPHVAARAPVARAVPHAAPTGRERVAEVVGLVLDAAAGRDRAVGIDRDAG